MQCFINPAFVVSGNCVDPQNDVVSCSGLAAALSGGHSNGNVGRNIFRRPRQSNLDFSISKVTKVTERTQIKLQWQAFNLFNHPAFASPQAGPTSITNAIISGGSFGNYGGVDVSSGDTCILATANRPRVMQFAVKFSF